MTEPKKSSTGGQKSKGSKSPSKHPAEEKSAHALEEDASVTSEDALSLVDTMVEHSSSIADDALSYEKLKEAEDSPSEEAEPAQIEKQEPAGLTAEQWLALSKIQLGVKPWIVRAAVSGMEPEKKYTEGEIRKLIQRKLSEPA